jgi:hypothetical protein
MYKSVSWHSKYTLTRVIWLWLAGGRARTIGRKGRSGIGKMVGNLHGQIGVNSERSRSTGFEDELGPNRKDTNEPASALLYHNLTIDLLWNIKPGKAEREQGDVSSAEVRVLDKAMAVSAKSGN